jgi:hypothetical protein
MQGYSSQPQRDITLNRCPNPSCCLPDRRTGESLRQETPRVSVRNNDRRQPRDRCRCPSSQQRRLVPSPPCLGVFFSLTQQAILPDCLHPRLEYTVAPLGLVAVYLSPRHRCCVGQGQAGSLHFHLCGNLWCVWHKIVMFLVFSCLKPVNRVSSRRKGRSQGWTLVSVVFVHGILGGRGNWNQNCVDRKESSEASSEKFVPPSNIVDKGGMTIRR